MKPPWPVVALVACGWSAPLVAQDPAPAPLSVRSAHLTAEIGAASADVEVHLEYRLNRRPATADDPIRAHALGVGGSRVDSFRVGGDPPDSARVQVLGAGTGVLREAEVDLSPEGDEVVSLRYRVQGAVLREGGEVRARIPLVVLDLPLISAAPSTFQAVVTVPDGWAVAHTFPSGLTGDGAAWSGDLQVIPAFVALQGRLDGRWRPGLPWALDWATVLILAGVGFVGWRHLTGVVREARA